jgi:hypothetical protein
MRYFEPAPRVSLSNREFEEAVKTANFLRHVRFMAFWAAAGQELRKIIGVRVVRVELVGRGRSQPTSKGVALLPKRKRTNVLRETVFDPSVDGANGTFVTIEHARCTVCEFDQMGRF